MTYQVKTAIFEGPLDLLLHLVANRQVDVTHLSLADLVTEYLAYVEEMRRLDLEVTSEFLLIAATLIQLKARHLLPDDSPMELDEELALMEERDRLLARLLTCVTFKDVAAVLAHRMREAERLMPRRGGMDQPIVRPVPEVHLSIDAMGLAGVAARVLAARHAEPDLDHLELELPSVDAALHDLQVRMGRHAEAEFADLVAHCKHNAEVIAYFLALLELARWGLVEVSQPPELATIRVRRRGEETIEEVASEWSR